MSKFIFILAGLGLIGFLFWANNERAHFRAHLESLERDVKAGPTSPGPRQDLPPEILALAKRLGARSDNPPPFIILEQSGLMWREPGQKPMGFTAVQTISQRAPDFLWKARFSPLGYLSVIDYHVGLEAGLEARLGSAVKVMHSVDSAAVRRGELMRYLAEIAFAPDAILMNRELDWTVKDEKTFVLGSGKAQDRAEVTLHLGTDGLIESMEASSRPAQEGNRFIERPWGGRFWDYQQIGGRSIAGQAEVYWMIDDKEFIYWRGKLTNWTLNTHSYDDE